MLHLQLKRVRFSKEADTWLRVLKSRTGITPNILCRMGLCLSLEERGVPDHRIYPEDSERQIDRPTLLGEYDAAFVALLRQRLLNDGLLTGDDLDDQFRAHVHRGIVLLANRLKELGDLGGSLIRQPIAEAGPEP